MKKRILSTLLTVTLMLSGCASVVQSHSADLMSDIKKSNKKPIAIHRPKDQETIKKEEITDFSLHLFQQSFEDKNLLLSPLSIVSALGMTANGAEGNTRLQMEQVLHTDVRGLNDYLNAYRSYLPNTEKCKVSLANSIWFKDEESLTINKEFLQTNKDYYNASIYKTPFDDSTKDDVNKWVSDQTDGMIDTLLEEAPSKDTIMYLINALSFDGEWEEIYNEKEIGDGEFNLQDHTTQKVKFMSHQEYTYLETKNATGFMKDYKDGKYAFVALLPNQSENMSDFIGTLDGTSLMDLLANPKEETVYTQIPKFSVEYEILLKNPLQKLGMTDAFHDEKADFSKMGESTKGNIFISQVIHKTKIDLDEKGTKAGAVTSVEMFTKSSLIEKPKEVILDRPFFYMIVDKEQNLPLFMGVLMNVI
ncbi:MAG: serpin family protein [Lachnospiraceae bacterium]